MKRILLITILIVGLTATYGFAQMGGGHMGSGQGMMSGQSQQQAGGSGYYPCQQMMGSMMGQGRMGGMMGSGMMGSGMMNGTGYQGNNSEAYQKYMDDTVGLRKKLHNKMFEYKEALRDPDTTRKSLLKIEKEMMNLKWDIYEKAPE